MTTADTREPVDVDDLAQPDTAYPVIVKTVQEHVVWVEADSAAEAYEQLSDESDWYERIDERTTLAGSWHEVRPIETWDWDTVERGGDWYQGLRADAHVEAWKHEQWRLEREASQAACRTAGHPEMKVFADRPYCPTCGYLKVEEVPSL